MRGKLFITLFLLTQLVVTYGQTSSLNSDFELGDFTGWSASNGDWNKSTHEVYFTNNTIIDGRQTIISENYYDRNTCGELPTIPPDGGNFVAKLGNNIKGAQAEQLRYSITVTEENALFIYKYAVVFEDPGHEEYEQPFFELVIKDVYGTIIDPICGYNRIISSDSIKGFEECVLDTDTTVRWKPWTTIALDLTPYLGQSIQLEFTNADCSKGGHWGYSYMDVKTGKMEINVKACESDSIAFLEAPEGFSSYLWSNGETSRIIELVSPPNGAKYTCTMATLPECTVTLQATVEVESLQLVPQDTTICIGSEFTLLASGADFYKWDNGLGSGAVKTIHPLSTTSYKVEGITKSGCTAEAISTITVIDLPIIKTSINSPCEGDSILLAVTTNDSLSFEWSGPNSFTSQIQNPIIENAQTQMAGTYTVSATNKYGCSEQESTLLNIKKLPELIIVHSNACEGQELFTQAFPQDLISYNWLGPNEFKSQNVDFKLTNLDSLQAGTYTLTATDTYGCTNNTSTDIIIYPNPKSNFTFDTVCEGEETVFTNLSSGADFYHWNFGNGQFSDNENPSGIIYTTPYSQNVQLVTTTNNGCSHDTSIVVNSYPIPQAQFTNNNACIGDSIHLLSTSFVALGSIDSTIWNINGDIYNTESLSLFAEDSSSIFIQLNIKTLNCSFSTNKTLTPDYSPELSEIISNNCSPHNVQFLTPYKESVIYVWDFDDSTYSSSPNPTHFFFNTQDSTQIYNVKQKATTAKGCSDSIIHKITVYPTAIAAFTASHLEVCSGQSIEFTDSSRNNSIREWYINNKLHATSLNTNYTFYNTTENVIYIPVKLYVSNEFNCEDSITKYITVYPFPTKGIVLSDSAACSPAIIDLSTMSFGSNYIWDLGDSTIEIGNNKLEHIYINTTDSVISFNISLNVNTNQGCSQEFKSKVDVFPIPQANFELDTNIACSPYKITATNLTQNASTFNWYIDNVINTNFSTNPTLELKNSTSSQQTHSIKLEAINKYNCSNKHELSALIFPEVNAQFNTLPESGCSPLNVDLKNTSTGANMYYWMYGDSTFSSNLHSKHTYVNIEDSIKEFELQLIAISAFGCIDTSNITTIQVFPQPRAYFVSDTISGCSPLNVTLVDSSKDVTQYMWDYGNGITSSDLIPTHNFNNLSSTNKTYQLKLIGINAYLCTDTCVQPITVYPEVYPDFSPDTTGCSPLEVSFKNLSNNAEVYIWNFGDGKISTVKNPKNTFVNYSYADTSFTVKLEAITHMGCRTSTTKEITVLASPNPYFVPSASQISFPESYVSFTNTTSGPWEYNWDFGDNTYSNLKDPETHYYENTGTYEVILEAKSNKCKDTVVHYIIVQEKGIKAKYDSSFSGCVPLTVKFTNLSENATDYEWRFGDGGISYEENPEYTFLNSGTFVIELIATNGNQKDISRAHTVTVYENPEAGFYINPPIVYLPTANINTYNQSYLSEKVTWYFGDGTTSNEYQPSHTYAYEGIYDVALAVESYDGCKDSIKQENAVEVLLNCGLKFPNAFTPTGENNSGEYNPNIPEITNDIFHPIFLNITSYNLQIFNRWGEIVFESNELEKGWNGIYKGEISKSDVYVWKCKATCLGGKNINQVGNVTLIR